MDQQQQILSGLVYKYLHNQLSSEEFEELWHLLNKNPDETALQLELQQLWQRVQDEAPVISASAWDEKMQLAKEKLAHPVAFINTPTPAVNFLSRYRWAVAAAVLLFISSTIFFLISRNSFKDNLVQQPLQSLQQDLQPGGDKAVLTLADGSTILLDSAGNGMLAQQGNTKVIKQEDGQLIYQNNEEPAGEVSYNTLQTPRGGQYKIILPDGSKVWLNAASSLKYPVVFASHERRVEITGEAYFEIAKDAAKPFKVLLHQMEVEVLGTHFNINGYADEENIKTTLLEGRVKINSTRGSNELIPGQQLQLNPNGTTKLIQHADLEEIVAWKEGNFQFDNSDIKTVMRQLSRWYDLDVVYRGSVSKHFIGAISRNVKLSQVLSMLQQTGEVKFIVEDKKIIVMP